MRGITPHATKMITYTIIDFIIDFLNGRLLIATTTRGICAVRVGKHDEDLVRELEALHPSLPLRASAGEDRLLRDCRDALIWYSEGKQPISDMFDIPLDMVGTPFQRQVWEQLCSIPYGETRSYQYIATAVGNPRATRAVGQACAANRILLMIPCHRVIRANGQIGGFSSDPSWKSALLTLESHHL